MKSNWNISGTGGCAVIDDGGSKRCQLSGIKLLLWNARSNLQDVEVKADFRVWLDNSTNNRGGMVLRSDALGNNCYRLLVYGPRTYYIQKVVNGIATTLAQVASTQAYNIYVKTRFRIDGYQLSVEEYTGGQWNLVLMAQDSEQTFQSGYAGIHGQNVNSSYSVVFDNVEISEKV